MKEALVITDLTRMQEGRVCVAGYTRKGAFIPFLIIWMAAHLPILLR